MTLHGPARLGHTRIAPAALRHVMEAVAAGAFGVRRDGVTVTFQEDAGKLGVDLLVRLPPPPLPGRTGQQQSAFERAGIARQEISSLSRQLTGMECGRINIRLAGAGHSAGEDRVDRPGRRQGRSKP